MLWSKNLISQNDSVQTYNNFVRQINAMQRGEQNILNKRFEDYNDAIDLLNDTMKMVKEETDRINSRLYTLNKIKEWARSH